MTGLYYYGRFLGGTCCIIRMVDVSCCVCVSFLDERIKGFSVSTLAWAFELRQFLVYDYRGF